MRRWRLYHSLCSGQGSEPVLERSDVTVLCRSLPWHFDGTPSDG